MPSFEQGVVDVIDALRGGARWVVVDGLGASGKTTFADLVAHGWADAQIVRLDDFTRPGAVEWESDRFLEQVHQPLSAGLATRYQRWHWTEPRPGEWVTLTAGRPVVLEGIGASDPDVAVDWDLRVWLEASEEERCVRAERRDPARFECWTANWRPIEARWAAERRPWELADIVVTS